MRGAEGAPLPREGQGPELQGQGPPRPGPARERRWAGHRRENLRRRMACVEGGRAPLGPQVGPKGRNPPRELEGYSGRGQGNCLLGEGAFPGE